MHTGTTSQKEQQSEATEKQLPLAGPFSSHGTESVPLLEPCVTSLVWTEAHTPLGSRSPSKCGLLRLILGKRMETLCLRRAVMGLEPTEGSYNPHSPIFGEKQQGHLNPV